MVVFLAQVGEHQNLGGAVVVFRKEVGRGVVGKVPLPAHHALFDEPGVWPHFQHLQVVVRFEDQAMAAAEVLLDKFRNVAKVRDHADLDSFRLERERHGINGVVRNGKGRDGDVADGEFSPAVMVSTAFRRGSQGVAWRVAAVM